MHYEVENVRHRNRQKKTWTELAVKDSQIQHLSNEDAMGQWRIQQGDRGRVLPDFRPRGTVMQKSPIFDTQ